MGKEVAGLSMMQMIAVAAATAAPPPRAAAVVVAFCAWTDVDIFTIYTMIYNVNNLFQ